MPKRKSGNGLLRKRADGRWEGRVVVGYDENDLPITKNVTSKSKSECQQKLGELIREYANTAYTIENDITFGKWIDFIYHTLSETQDESKQVNIISYNNAKPKIDIRNWFENNKMGKGITLDEQEWEILGSCFGGSLSDGIDYAEILSDKSYLSKTEANTYKIDLADFDITIDYESEIVLDQEQKNISFSIQFKVGETKVMKYVDFLNAVNKYFSEYIISANAFVDFVDEEPIIKIIANIPLCPKATEPMMDALEDFLSEYADDINGIGAFSARQLYFENVIVIGDRSSCMHEEHTTECYPLRKAGT